MRPSRFRNLMLAIILMALTVVTARPARANAAVQPDLDSGALGLTRAQIEAEWGAATEPVVMPGRPMHDTTYAYGSEEHMRKASEAGFDRFVRKPCDAAELARLILQARA